MRLYWIYLDWKRSSGWLQSWEGLLFATDVLTTCAEAIWIMRTIGGLGRDIGYRYTVLYERPTNNKRKNRQSNNILLYNSLFVSLFYMSYIVGEWINTWPILYPLVDRYISADASADRRPIYRSRPTIAHMILVVKIWLYLLSHN